MKMTGAGRFFPGTLSREQGIATMLRFSRLEFPIALTAFAVALNALPGKPILAF
jgi:hypothetical protein